MQHCPLQHFPEQIGLLEDRSIPPETRIGPALRRPYRLTLALGHDGWSLAFADADTARDAHRDESCNQSKQNFLHWVPPVLTDSPALNRRDYKHKQPPCSSAQKPPSQTL